MSSIKTYDKYKDSGIEWIGKIPAHWQIDKFSRIFNRITDYVASGSFADIDANVQYLDEPDYAMLVRTADLSGTKDKGYISTSTRTIIFQIQIYLVES